jgi:thioredoxin reductase (NADPH)
VTVIHQFGHFQAFEYAIEEARNNPRINFIMESVVTGFNGEEKLESVDIKNLVTGETGNLRTEGAFVFIGYVPNTGFLEGMVPLNRGGEIIVDSDMSVNIEGVYAAGDCTAGKYRQVTTAVGEGTIAALAASAYISELRVKQKQAAEI